ncbi:hypothetical protein H1230_30225 [Paenibacillus sp. 19GGS1-52]|uniref:hypothetical protein n=1 Tax=Paenibacillus sp. 19GGS1-52 TaxID=2758563 RepID=UPI001EFA327A|nr:hypothetical protein [Paenibacillus sp. 19GGS1-52]ULO07166.1 hypothetical protein H1230_30225 [Paenibacillus sp. 19GGS1-52]
MGGSAGRAYDYCGALILLPVGKLTAADSREIRDLLRKFLREDLLKIARDYVGFAEYQGRPCELTLELINSRTDEQLRKFIFERDYPGYSWRGQTNTGHLSPGKETGDESTANSALSRKQMEHGRLDY